MLIEALSKAEREGRLAEKIRFYARASLLIVDDDNDIRTLLAEQLGRAGYQVSTAADGTAMRQLLDREHVDLIVLDLNLPKYDGRQLLEQIKNDAELCTIPVVVLTTSSAEEDILKSYKLHANAYVTKPVDLDQFMSAVRQIDEFFVQVVRLPQF